MAQVTDSSSTPIKSALPPADTHEEARAAVSPAQENGLDIEYCIQDLDPSHSLTVSHVGDCNLECSYCAVRWSARRVQDLQDS
jgi:pyruvate-formate lyase-activating enzyme